METTLQNQLAPKYIFRTVQKADWSELGCLKLTVQNMKIFEGSSMFLDVDSEVHLSQFVDENNCNCTKWMLEAILTQLHAVLESMLFITGMLWQ